MRLQRVKISKMSQAAFDVEEDALKALFSEVESSPPEHISAARQRRAASSSRMKPNSLCLDYPPGRRNRKRTGVSWVCVW